MNTIVDEAALHRWWLWASLGELVLNASNSQSYRVLYSGIHSPHQGPDFKDAVLELHNGKRIVGDIEIHTNEADWYKHKHHLDSNYNNVILHIIAEPAHRPAVTRSGRQVVSALANQTAPPSVMSSSLFESLLSSSDLEAANDERFLTRAERFKQDILEFGSEQQTLYTAIMDCLGYSANRLGFRQLSNIVPWEQLSQRSSSVGDFETRVALIKRILLTAAGFGPNTTKLPVTTARPYWNRFYGRPFNHPVRRIGGGAYLFARALSYGGLVNYCRELINLSPGRMIKELIAPSGGSGPALIGKARSAEIIVNAVLPALFAINCRAGAEQPVDKILGVYRRFPLTPDNSLIREVKHIARSRGVQLSVTNARQQQGLLHLYKKAIQS